MRTRVLLIGAHARDRCTGPKHYRNLEQETGLRSANASFSVVQGFHVSSMLKVGEQLMQFRTVSKDQFKRKWGMVKVAKADATTHVAPAPRGYARSSQIPTASSGICTQQAISRPPDETTHYGVRKACTASLGEGKFRGPYKVFPDNTAVAY